MSGFGCVPHRDLHSFPTRRSSDLSRSALRALVTEAEGFYSYWETGRRAPVRELLMNEGLARAEEHTSELQSPCNIVCRRLLAKKRILSARAAAAATFTGLCQKALR